MTHFDCTVAPDDSCEAHARAGQPCGAWPVAFDQPPCDGAGSGHWRNNFGGWTPSETGRDQSPWNDVEKVRPYEDLKQLEPWCKRDMKLTIFREIPLRPRSSFTSIRSRK